MMFTRQLLHRHKYPALLTTRLVGRTVGNTAQLSCNYSTRNLWQSTRHVGCITSQSVYALGTSRIQLTAVQPIIRRPMSSYYNDRPNTSIPIARPILFTVLLAGASFGIAGIIYEQRRISLIQRARSWLHKDRPSLSEVIQVQKASIIEKTRAHMERIKDIDALPEQVKRIYFTVMNKWYSTSPSERFLAGIVGINAAVFLAWQIPRLTPFMARHFMHYPGVSQPYTLLTACFSHREIWHFGFNMMALWSFGHAVLGWMSREEFTAFYLTAGTLASLGSHVLTARLKPLSVVSPSLGASGAIFGLFASCAWKYPDAQVHMIFLPMLPIKIGHGLAGLMALDLVGAVRGWQMFDHYAHLSGAISGLLYMQYGHSVIWDGIQQRLIAIRKSA
ncbi:hypothetical protein BDF19DRAFT_444960 [Syncephalis fuscata]|nr:hypothetical protein BDF19DRAFT_444960 [Syncephalis fuscata]